MTQPRAELVFTSTTGDAEKLVPRRDPTGRKLMWIAVLVQVAFVYVGRNGSGATSTLQIGAVRIQLVSALLVVATLAVVAARLAIRTKELAAQVALTVMISIFVAFPITRLTTAPRVLLILSIGAPVVMALSGLMGGKGRRLPLGTTAVAVLFAALAWSSLISLDKGGLLRLVLMLSSTFPVFLLSGQIGSDGRQRITDVILTMAVVQSIIAIVEPLAFPNHLFGPAQRNSDGEAVPLVNGFLGHGIERSQGTLGHPLPLGLLLVLSLALVLKMWHGPEAIRWSVVLLLLVGLVFTGNRNSLLLAVGLILFFPTKRMTPGRFVAAIVAAGLIFVAAVYSGLLSSSALDQFAASGSYGHRLAAYQAFGQLMTNQHLLQILVGNGSASLTRLFAEGLLQTDGFNVVDNQYVLTLAQGGLIALVALVYLCLRGLLRASRPIRGAVLAVLATGLIFDWMSWTSTGSLCFFVLGVALTVDVPAGSGSVSPNLPPLQDSLDAVDEVREKSVVVDTWGGWDDEVPLLSDVQGKRSGGDNTDA